MKEKTNACTALKNAAVSLMKKRVHYPFKVTDLCNLASINRSTFYDHYENVDFLMKDLFTDYLRALDEDVKADYWNDDRDAYVRQLIRTLAKMKEDSSMFRLCLLPEYFTIYEKTLYEYYTADIVRESDPYSKKYANLFQISGGLKVIHQWLLDGTPLSVEELAECLAVHFTSI